MPEDHERRGRDLLRACKHKTTVSEHLSSFRNLVLTILDMGASEKWDKFVSGLKSKIQFEVRKANCNELEEATKIAMHVETEFAGVSNDVPTNASSRSGPTTMDSSEFRRNDRSKQRLLDIRNNACSKSYKPGCRPWKHRKNVPSNDSVANIEAALAEEEAHNDVGSDSSEN